jgi:acyltransferase
VKPRSSGLDLLRIVGITCVVVGHVWGDVQVVRSAVYSWHVPVFFFLTGYLWTYGRALRVEIDKRTSSLAYPYLCWLFLIGVPFIAWQTLEQGQDPLRLAAGIVYGADLGRPFSAFWFVAALFFTAVLIRAAESLPRPVVWSAALAAVALTYVLPELFTRSPLALGLSLPCTVFVLAGQEYRRVAGSVPRWMGGLLVTLGALAVVVAGPVDLKAADFGSPVLSAVSAVLISAGLVRLATEIRLPASGTVAVSRLSGAGLVVVLTHAAFLWVTDSRLSLPAVVSFVVALLGSWLVGLWATRIPGLSGRSRVPAARSG